MAHISERIKQLRTGAGMTQEEFGKKFGIVKSTVSLYENGKSTPNDEIKIKICEYFNVPLDYLIGLSNGCVHINTEKLGGMFLFDNKSAVIFEDLLKKKNMSKKILSQKTGISIEILDNWFASCVPSLEQLVLVADEFQTTIDHLLGREDCFCKITNEKDYKSFNTFSQLNEDNQDIIIGKMKELLKEQKYEESVAADKLKKAK